jgi:soluble lytic murein transglycosylase-like protein
MMRKVLLASLLWGTAVLTHANTAAAPDKITDSTESIARNSPAAVAELCRLARRGDAQAQYELAWVFAHGQGPLRRDDWASYLFYAAGTQGHKDARQMMTSVTWPAAEVPECFTKLSSIAAAMQQTPALVSPTIKVVAPAYIEKLVRQLAPQFKVPPHLALAIIHVESSFDTYAVSPAAAMGLMQLIPQTAQRFNVKNAFDPQQNIRGGMAYLRWLLAYYEGDVSLVAAAYNAGEGAVDRHKGVPPFNETREYVKRVIARVGNAPLPFDRRAAPPSPRLADIRKNGPARVS